MSLPRKLYTAEQTRELDRIAIEEWGIPGIRLMKSAGRVVFEQISERWPGSPLIIFCGAGNNGGDGYIVAALAAAKGLQVQLLQLAPPEKLRGDALKAFQFAETAGVEMVPFAECISLQTGVIVDAMLGTGFSGAVREPTAQAIHLINRSGLPVVAVDIPSGLSSDTGAADIVVEADLTCTFIGLKQGLFTGRGPAVCGELIYSDLGVPETVFAEQPAAAEILELDELMGHLPEREKDAHKGNFGHLLVIGGDCGFGGAALLAAEAALRSGAGLVSVCTRPEHVPALLARQPEIMAKGVVSGQELEPFLTAPTVLVVGPGLGQSPWSEQMLQKAIASGTPAVLDADALNLLSLGRIGRDADLSGCVLTPHPGEAARLLGISSAEVQANRFSAVRDLQHKFGCPVVLKGAGSLVCTGNDQAVAVCTTGNPGMASGGMGDVLSGIVGGLMAQNLTPRDALKLAVCLHGTAADRAAISGGERGLLATDLMLPLRKLVNGL